MFFVMFSSVLNCAPAGQEEVRRPRGPLGEARFGERRAQVGAGREGEGGGAAERRGTNCIKIGLPGKLNLSKSKGLQEVLFS